MIVCIGYSEEAIEEAGASNFFAVYPNNTLVTPSCEPGTILEGVTRASILELAAKECGLTVIEGRLTLEDLKGACEAFCCGTGASVTPVGSVSLWSTSEIGSSASDAKTAPVAVFGNGESPGPVTRRIYDMLLGLQMGTDKALSKKYADWIHIVEPP